MSEEKEYINNDEQVNITIKIKDSSYCYSEINNLKTWRDSTGMILPVFLHKTLRETAIDQGFSPSHFDSNGVIMANSINDVDNESSKSTETKNKSKNSAKFSINPFN